MAPVKDPIYLDTLPSGSLLARVAREWNSGQVLESAIERLGVWHNADPQRVREIWSRLEAQYGDAPIGWSPAMRARSERVSRKNPAYSDWKGWTGPGQQLREILAAERSLDSTTPIPATPAP